MMSVMLLNDANGPGTYSIGVVFTTTTYQQILLASTITSTSHYEGQFF